MRQSIAKFPQLLDARKWTRDEVRSDAQLFANKFDLLLYPATFVPILNQLVAKEIEVGFNGKCQQRQSCDNF